MAGSYIPTGANSPDDIQQHLEGLKFLAEHVNEPIAILDADLKVVYANPSADQLIKDCPSIPPHVSASSEAVNEHPNFCTPCHVMSLFRPHEKVEHSFSIESTWVCPLPRVVPIYSKSGSARFAVLMAAHSDRGVCEEVPLIHGQAPAYSEEPLIDEMSEHAIIGESKPMQQLLRMIHLIAASEATVLIQGESGTGKELVAKTIHALSHRRQRPFVVVECSSLPETLLESELFGHVRGAFTGAVAERKGLFEEAEGGTIFLDEIADTTPAFQARLLRVLQEGEIKPVGSNQSIKVNVRILSAGNTPLEELVKVKKFRADLYYRLAVLPLTVPSLRDRKEDIPLLVQHFLRKSTQKHDRAPMMVSREAQLVLIQHQWPGNVRELENIIERGVVTCHAQTLEPKDLLIEHTGEPGRKDLNSIGKVARQEAERKQILQALHDTKGDKTRAARLLNISRSSLYNKLRDCNI